MVLIVNCNPKPEVQEWFARAVVPRLEEIAGRPAQVVNLDQLEDPAHTEAGRRLFENFFRTSPTEVFTP